MFVRFTEILRSPEARIVGLSPHDIVSVVFIEKGILAQEVTELAHSKADTLTEILQTM